MKFLVDNMLGRLGNWLRLFGIDAKQVKRKDKYEDIIYYSLSENRILLTKSKKISKHKVYSMYYVKSDNWKDQIEEVIKKFRIGIDSKKFFSRCVVCNKKLLRIEKEKVKDKVPEYVFQINDIFYRCPECNRIFWKGTHFELANILIKKLLKN